MDLDFSISGFAEGCGPRFNRGVWALFKVVARRLCSSQICAQNVYFQCLVYSVSSVLVYLYLWVCLCDVLMTVYLNILKEFDKNICIIVTSFLQKGA